MACSPQAVALRLLLAAAALSPALSSAADVVKANNTTALSTGTSWVGGVNPGSGDIALFDGTYATTGTLTYTGTQVWQGIRITSPGGNLVITNGTAGQYIALGSGGIDMSAATVNANIQRIRIDASQTWNIGSGRVFTLGNGARGGQFLVNAAGFTITKSGAGTAQLDMANITLGSINWRFEGGVVRAIWNEASAWGTGTLTLAGGGIATGTSFGGSVGNWTWNNAITLATGTSSFIDNQNIAGADRWLKLSGVMSGSGNVEFRDTGTAFNNSNFGFIIGNNNTNSGTVTIAANAEVRVGATTDSGVAVTGNSGKLAADSASVINNGTLSFSRLDAHTVANAISGSGQLRIGLNAVSTALGTSTATQVVTLSGALSGAGTMFIYNGGAIITGNNTRSGGNELQGGNLTVSNLDNAGGVGSAGTGYIAVKSGSTLNYTGGSVTATRALFLDNGAATVNVSDANAVLTWNDANLKGGASGGLITKAGSGTLALGGAISSGGTTAVAVTGGTLRLSGANTYTGGTALSSGATLEIAGTGSLATTAITGAGALRMSGSGTLTLSSTSNTYTGGTTVSNGTLTLGAAGVLADAGAVTISGGTFDLGTFAETVGTVSLSSGTIQNGTLTSNNDYLVSGGTVAANAILAGSVGLTKSGSGSATLNGSQTFTGATSVSNGTLVLTAGTSLASTSIVIGNGATLETADGLTLGAGRTLSLGSGSTIASGNKTGNLTFNGGVLAIDFDTSSNDLLAVSGDVTVTSGSISFAKAGSYTSGTFDILSYGGALTGDPLSLTLVGLSSDGTSRQTFNLFQEAVAKKLQLVVGGQAENVRWTGLSDSNWNAGITGAANWLVTGVEYTGDQPNRFFNGDTVVFDDSASSGTVTTGTLDVSPGSVTVSASTLDYTIGGVGVIAAGALNKSGAATLTLTSANTYSGGTNLSAGRIRLGVNNALGSGAINLSGGTLSSDGTDARSLNNAINLSGNATLGNATNSGELTLSGAIDLGAASRTLTTASNAVLTGLITNGGDLVKGGSAKLTFTGSNILRTGLDVTSGTAALGSSNVINDAVSVTVRSGATLDLAGFSDTLATLTLDSGATVTAGTITATTVTVGGTTLGATLVGSTALVKNGTGILDLTTASVRSGATTISAGGIRVADNAALGTSTLALNGGTLTADATGRTLANATTIGGNVTLGEAGAGLLTFSNTVNLGGGTRVITTNANTRFSGAVSNGSLTKAGNGTLTLSAAGTMTATAIQAGKIEMVGTVNSLGTGGIALTDGAELALSMSAANVNVNNVFTGTGRIAKNTTNRFFINGDNSNAVIEWYWASNDPAGTAGGLGFANGAAMGGAGSKITVADGITASAFINATGQTAAIGVEISTGGTYQWNGSTANTNTFTGVISGGGTFTKISGETLIATAVHTHTGAFNVSAGIFQVAQSGKLGGAAGDFAGALALAGTLYHNSDADQTFSGIVSGAGALRKGNTSTLLLTGANTHTGQTLVEQGTVRLTGSQTGASNTNKVVNVATVAGQTAAYEVDGGNLSLTGTNSLIIGDLGTGTFTLTSGTVSLGSGGVWIGDAANTSVGTLDIQGGSFTSSGALVVATRGTGTVNVTGGSATFGSISLGHAAGTGQSATVNLGTVTVTTGSITGQVVATTRDLSLDGTTVRASASSVSFLQDLTSAKVGSSGVTFDTNGFNITVAQSLTENASSLGGGLTKTGTGALTLSGNNTLGGSTTLSAGTLIAGSDNAFGEGVIAVNGGTFDINGRTLANDITFTGGTMTGSGTLSGTIAGLTSFTKSGVGSLTLSGTNDLGPITIEAGTLVAGSSGALGSSGITLNGGILNAGGQTLANAISITSGEISGSGTFNGAITGLGGLVKTGAGTVTLGGANSYGTTLVSEGTLALTGSGTLGAGVVTIASGGTLNLAGASHNSDIELNGGALAGAANMASFANVNVTANSTISGSVGGNIQLGANFARTMDITGDLSVAGTLSGVGSFTGGDLTILGTHAVGNSPGYQSITGDVTYGAGSFFDWEFQGVETWGLTLAPVRSSITGAGDYDAVDVLGNLTISPGAYLRILPLPDEFSVYADTFWANTEDGMSFQVFAATGTITGMFSFANGSNTLALDGLGNWTLRRENLLAGEGAGIYITYAIPEPSTYGLMLGGLALAAAAWRRRKTAKASAPEIKPLS